MRSFFSNLVSFICNPIKTDKNKRDPQKDPNNKNNVSVSKLSKKEMAERIANLIKKRGDDGETLGK
jgi:hypothetical protein